MISGELKWSALALLFFLPVRSPACSYCGTSTDVCISYDQVCDSYSERCTAYQQVCTSEQQVCTSYSDVCTAYDVNGDCVSYTQECNAYTTQCVAYDNQCVSYVQVCNSYTPQCTAYQTQCTSYYYGDYVTVVGSVKSNATNEPIGGSNITSYGAGGLTASAVSDGNGLYSTTVFVYDDANGNLNVNTCANANQLYAAQCKSVAVADNCTEPTRTVNFARSPVFDGSDFVAALYRDVLSRTASEGEIHSWTDTLQNANRGQVALGFLSSGEYHADLVASYYQNILGRTAGPSEIAGWANALNAGATDQQVLVQFAASGEFYQKAGGTPSGYVTALYKTLLKRTPSQAEVSNWVAGWNGNPLPFAQGFVYSGEFRGDLVNAWYQAYLHRSADPGGLASWSNALASGTTDEQVQAGILGSGEYLGLNTPAGFTGSALNASSLKSASVTSASASGNKPVPIPVDFPTYQGVQGPKRK